MGRVQPTRGASLCVACFDGLPTALVSVGQCYKHAMLDIPRYELVGSRACFPVQAPFCLPAVSVSLPERWACRTPICMLAPTPWPVVRS
jgi:hypothetical protein